MKRVLVLALCLAFSAVAFGQGSPGGQTGAVTPDIPGVVAGGTKIELIKEGFQGSEGGVPLPDGSMLFSETAASRTIKIDKNNVISTFLENTNASNGMAFDSKGRLITTQYLYGNTKVGVIYPKGSETVLADNFEGKPFGRPNDLVIDKNGGVYFTDSANPATTPAPKPALPPAVYYISPDRKLTKVVDDVGFPNGLTLSHNEQVLYLIDRSVDYILAFDVQPNGTLRNRRNFAKYQQGKAGDSNGGDGLLIDSDSRLYAATAIGVQVFGPQGQHLGTIALPKAPQNLAFGGADKRILYVFGRGAAYKIQMRAAGIRQRAR
jgi:gluconolactonase